MPQALKAKLDKPLILIAVSLVIALFLFNLLITIPKVGIIKIDTSIVLESTKDSIVEMLRWTEEQRDVKAVVLYINSPGGEASKIEEIYLETLKLRSEKPVVVSIGGSGASGAYYISVAANYIYAKPSSEIGNIGVISVLPEPLAIDEEEVITGPYKVSGQSQKYYISQIEMIKENFLQSVISQRGEKLKLSKEELAEAKIYLGIEGVKYGLVDEIGSLSDAINKAAELAGIANYGAVDVNEELGVLSPLYALFVKKEDLTKQSNTLPMNYYMYFEVEK